MTILSWINTAILIIGVPAIIGALIYVGKKLQVLETLQETNSKIKHNLTIISHFLSSELLVFLT